MNKIKLFGLVIFWILFSRYTDAQKGSLFAGVLKILPVFILVLPGVIGYVLFKYLTKGKLTGIFDNRLLAGYLFLTMVILYAIFG